MKGKFAVAAISGVEIGVHDDDDTGVEEEAGEAE